MPLGMRNLLRTNTLSVWLASVRLEPEAGSLPSQLEKSTPRGGVRAEDMGRQGKPTKENCARADGTEVRNVGEGVPSKTPPRGISHGVDLGADSAAKADGGYPRLRAILGDGHEDCF